jgi:hypothetical protein
MNSPEVQQKLFNVIKARMEGVVSQVDEIASVLDISTDSAYRRMRGEKQVSFEELITLCTKYRVSVDQILGIQTGTFSFMGELLNEKTHRYEDFLKGMMQRMGHFASTPKKQFYYLCKDVPMFHHWQCRPFATFKYFFWMSILVYFPEFRNRKVAMEEYADELWELGQKTLFYYNLMDSFEVWNMESLNATLRQIEYYRDVRMFKSDSDALLIYESLQKTLNHIEEQARLGYKFDIEDREKKPLGKFALYFNEIIILDNSMLIVQDNSKMAVVQHTVINYMLTRDITFCEHLEQYINNLMRRSTLISETSEKERSAFFHNLQERIERRKEKLNL